jgi:hypothetical protein
LKHFTRAVNQGPTPASSKEMFRAGDHQRGNHLVVLCLARRALRIGELRRFNQLRLRTDLLFHIFLIF